MLNILMFGRKKIKRTEKLVQIDGIGQVRLVRSTAARRITLSVRPPCRVRVGIPAGMGWEDALSFVESRRGWLETALERMNREQQKRLLLPPMSVAGRQLRLYDAGDDDGFFRLSDSEISVYIPRNLLPSEEPAQELIRRAVIQACRETAKQVLPDRVREIARMHGFSYGNVSVRNSSTRWGSCSARNDISLSISLVRLPVHLRDYIILHELCHTVHKNHGPGFHSLLDKCCAGGHLQLRAELRQYSARI